MKKINLIAELCQNHFGDMSIVEEMIHAAKENGADFVKIQSMRSKDLNYRNRFEKGLIEGGAERCKLRPFNQEYQRLKNLDLSIDDHFKFLELCKKYKIKPMTTIFTRNRINLAKKMKLDYLKISSFDCSSHAMIKDIVSKVKSKMIVSTGGAYDREIANTVEILKFFKRKFTLLHCISIYPTIPEVASLLRIKFLKQLNNSVGFSDHSNPDIYSYDLSALSTTLGATWIERHFTILKKNATKDGVVSVNPSQLKELREAIDLPNKQIINYINKKYKKSELSKILGSSNRELTNDEMLNRDYYQGRFASKTKLGKVVYNWDSGIRYSDIKQI
jgi:N,N'-diacetyllegionaminate synthase